MTVAPKATLPVDNFLDDPGAVAFCNDFISGKHRRFVLGSNIWARSIAECIDIDGFIDEFTDEQECLGKPIIKLDALPADDCMVVSAVVGRPHTAMNKLTGTGIRCLDYFGFRKYSELPIIQARFQDEFILDFKTHRDRYDWIYGLLSDEKSQQILTKIVNFRLADDLRYMQGFTDTQNQQYFENFLELKPVGESFVDVGSFDGYTSLEFIKHCPNYTAIHVFEPEPKNMAVVKKQLSSFQRILYYNCGLSNCSQMLRFETQGSVSCINTNGDIEVNLERLDDVVQTPFTFLKMDIEGGEPFALEGAKHSIAKHYPRLAISVYHRFDDLWRIPEKILSIRDDYQVYLRHYTECVDETVMFFIPQQ